MKNKIIISLLSLCALLASASCSKDGSDTILPGANLSLRLKIAGTSATKTSSGSWTESLESESAISSLAICLVAKNGSDPIVPNAPVTSISDTKEIAWKLISDGVYEVNAIVPSTITGDYLLYVIANRPSWMNDESIDTYGELCGAFSGTAANMAACWTANNFLMVNEHDAVTDPSVDQAGVSVTMNPTGAKVTASVTIERLATKIRVKKNLNMEVAPLLTQVLCTDPDDSSKEIKGAIAAMSLEGYALFNCVNSFNLIQRWNAGQDSGQVLESPSSYTGVQTDHSDAYSMTDGYYDNIPSDLIFSELGTVFYCQENNSPYYKDVAEPGDATEGTKMKGRVTGLVFKARAGYALSFSGDATITENIDVDDNTVAWTTKGGDSDGATNDDILWNTLYQYKGDYYGDIACLLKHNPALVSSSSTVEALRAAGVKVYEDGYMYYNYWITDPNYTDGGKNYLSVMRNTFYDINITAINSLGDEFPCGGTGYNPSDPISVDVPKLTLSIDIPDWTDKTGNYTIQ